jgi:hypothetical protein
MESYKPLTSIDQLYKLKPRCTVWTEKNKALNIGMRYKLEGIRRDYYKVLDEMDGLRIDYFEQLIKKGLVYGHTDDIRYTGN